MLVQFFFLIWLQACYWRIHFAFDSEKLLFRGFWRRKSHFRAKYRSYSKFDDGFGILTKIPTQKYSCQFFLGSILSPWEGKNGSTFLSQCSQPFLLNFLQISLEVLISARFGWNFQGIFWGHIPIRGNLFFISTTTLNTNMHSQCCQFRVFW